MRLTNLAPAVLAAVLVGLTALQVRAGEEPAATGAEEKAEYVGDKECFKCHLQQHKSWKTTSMAKAMKTLKPTTEADNKELFDRKVEAKLDPAKDYTTDEKCLKCHTTGYGEPGGYPKDLKADDAAAAKRAALMGAVACEACHGPGSLYVKHKTEAQAKDKDAKFTFEGLAKLGLVKPDANVCAKCHNKDAPTQPKEEFKFEDAKTKVHPAKKK